MASIDSSGNASFCIVRPVAYDFLNPDESAIRQLAAIRPDWIYFGTLAQTAPANEALLKRLLVAVPSQRFYDMNLRDGQWDLELVRRLSGLATIVKLNESEAEALFRLTDPSEKFSLERFCRSWSQAHGNEVICVTLGERGCAVWSGGALQTFPGVAVKVVDTIGSGDAFSAAFLHGFHLGWPMPRTAAFANALGALVASRPGATPFWNIEELPMAFFTS